MPVLRPTQPIYGKIDQGVTRMGTMRHFSHWIKRRIVGSAPVLPVDASICLAAPRQKEDNCQRIVPEGLLSASISVQSDGTL